MIKKVFALLVVMLFSASMSAFAGGSGNCIEPLKLSTENKALGAAFGYDFMANRLLELDQPGSDVDSMSIKDLSHVYGKIILGRNENTNFYAKVGGAYYDLEFDDEGVEVKVQQEGGILAGLGFNVLNPWKKVCGVDLNIGYDIQANFFINEPNDVSRGGTGAGSIDGIFYGINGKNSVYLSTKYSIEKLKTSLIPYLGAYHSWIAIGTLDDLSYTAANTSYGHDIRVNYDALAFGPMVGMDVEITQNVLFNIEGRFVGENSLTTGATLKF